MLVAVHPIRGREGVGLSMFTGVWVRLRADMPLISLDAYEKAIGWPLYGLPDNVGFIGLPEGRSLWVEMRY